MNRRLGRVMNEFLRGASNRSRESSVRSRERVSNRIALESRIVHKHLRRTVSTSGHQLLHFQVKLKLRIENSP